MTKRRTRPAHMVVTHTIMHAAFNDGMYLVALVTPILTIPQLLTVWMQHRTGGVSLVTWGAYATMSGIWLIYGLVQRQKPLILSQACLLVIDSAVVLGAFIFRS